MLYVHLVIHSMSGSVVGLKTYIAPLGTRVRITRVRHLQTNIVMVNGKYINVD